MKSGGLLALLCAQYIRSDPAKGISFDGLVYLYGKAEQKGNVNTLQLNNGILLVSALIVCVSLHSIFEGSLSVCTQCA